VCGWTLEGFEKIANGKRMGFVYLQLEKEGDEGERE
jgi:hypothetical protein